MRQRKEKTKVEEMNGEMEKKKQEEKGNKEREDRGK